MQSEVAFHPSPDKFILPKSNRLTLFQQQYMISEYSIKLQMEFGSEEIKAIMGDAPDYSLLAFLHLDTTGKYLFGAEYSYPYVRTKTVGHSSHAAIVGYFSAAWGLRVGDWNARLGFERVHATPLVVPA
ncbi:MAG: hypothetical protein HYW62_04125 [Candidatus Levybacteria bacterium]|nr:hypothetical protein [Candidatus Levybacteria bacterium]